MKRRIVRIFDQRFNGIPEKKPLDPMKFPTLLRDDIDNDGVGRSGAVVPEGQRFSRIRDSQRLKNTPPQRSAEMQAADYHLSIYKARKREAEANRVRRQQEQRQRQQADAAQEKAAAEAKQVAAAKAAEVTRRNQAAADIEANLAVLDATDSEVSAVRQQIQAQRLDVLDFSVWVDTLLALRGKR